MTQGHGKVTKYEIWNRIMDILLAKVTTDHPAEKGIERKKWSSFAKVTK